MIKSKEVSKVLSQEYKNNYIVKYTIRLKIKLNSTPLHLLKTWKRNMWIKKTDSKS